MKTNQCLLLALVVLISAAIGCKKKSVEMPIEPSSLEPIICDSLQQDFDMHVQSSDCIYFQAPIETPLLGEVEETITDTEICTTTHFTFGPGFDLVNMFSPSEVIYLGSLLNGFHLLDGSWTPIGFNERNPLTMSLTIPTGGEEVENTFMPTNSAYEETHNNLVAAALPESTPAYVNFEINEVRAYEESLGHIGASFGGWGADIAGSYDYSSEHIESRFLIKFQQKYYSADLDIPAQPSDWFECLPNYDQLLDRCPTYISSITYGRMFYIVIESTNTAEETRQALNASFNGFGANFNFDANHEHASTFENMNIKAFIIGGNSSNGVEAVGGVNALGELISSGAQMSQSSPGVPIAFTVRRLSDNSTVEFVTIEDFNVQECTVVGIPATVDVDSSILHSFCPVPNDYGDSEFGGEALVVGNVQLILENNKIWGAVEALFDEPDENGGSNDTGATMDPNSDQFRVHLYSPPLGYTIAGILVDDQYTYFNHLDTDHQAHSVPFVNTQFVEEIIINGDTSGNDLGCNGEDDAYIKVRFKSFDVLLNPQ